MAALCLVGVQATTAGAQTLTTFVTGGQLYNFNGLAFDAGGNLFVAYSGNHVVLRIDAASRVITVVAGQDGIGGFDGDGSAATSALLYRPMDVAVDAAGNLYIADGNMRVRKVDASGKIDTVAGDGSSASGDGGAATAAGLGSTLGVAVDAAGNLYIAAGQRIRKVDAAGIITTIAGSVPGFSGDDGPAGNATLHDPWNIVVASNGDLFVADYTNGRIRRIDAATGIITTFAGGGSTDGSSGKAGDASLGGPAVDMALDPFGNVYVASELRAFKVVRATGDISILSGRNGSCFPGGPDGPAADACFGGIRSLGAAANGDLYITDGGGPTIFRVPVERPAGGRIITTVAGTGTYGWAGDGGSATLAQVASPQGIVVDGDGNVYFADDQGSVIRRIAGATGTITSVAGQSGTLGFNGAGDGGPATAAQLGFPSGLALDAAGNLYIADWFDGRVRKIDRATGIITTVAGDGGFDFGAGDGGLATAASLAFPQGVAVDGSGNLYIADTEAYRVRTVSAATGVITTIGGTGNSGFSGDGGPATSATFSYPIRVAVDASGNVYVLDRSMDPAIRTRVRRIAPGGTITTIAGGGTSGGWSGPAVGADLGSDAGDLAVDDGGLFIVGLWRVWRVDLATGLIEVVAGTGAEGYSGDEGPAIWATMRTLGGIGVSPAGDLFLSDTGNSRLRKVSAAVGTAPTLTSITPTSAAPGATLTVIIDGTNLTAATVNVDSDISVSIISVSDTRIDASFSVAASAAPGPRLVSVTNSGGTSNTLEFNVSSAPADLAIAKSHTGNFTQGQTGATYSIVVTNNSGVGPTTGTVTVTDTLPAGLTLAAAGMAGSGWACSGLSCTRSDVLAAGASYPGITVTVDVAASAPASVTNTASVSGGGETNTGNNTASDVTAIAQLPDLTITKSHAGTFSQGQVGATYSIVVTNSGGGPTIGPVSVNDLLPAGLTATAVAGTGWNCTLLPVRCSRFDLLVGGASYPAITVTVNVSATAPSTLTNVGVVVGSAESNSGNNSASDPTTITASAQPSDVTIAKTHSGSFTQGQTGATYTIVVTNSGAGPTTAAVSVADSLPSGLTATAIAGTGWTCSLSPLGCSRSDALAAGASYPAITLTVDVAMAAPANVTNTASVSGGGETNTGNNTASDVTVVAQLPDLTIAKNHSGTFSQGQSGATYSIVVTNSGAGPTTAAVSVADGLPSGLTATAIAGTGWTCSLSPLGCSRSDVLAAGASYPAITLTVDAAMAAPASLTNTASVSGGGETNTGNNTVDDVTAIAQLPDLTIAKTHSGTFSQGQSGATYTIVVTNSGAGPTTAAVSVADSLPSGLTATAIAGTGWTCSLSPLGCSRSDVLAAGASYPAITLTVGVAMAAPASLTNTASVSGGGETNTGNNTVDDVTTIAQLPDVTIAKTHSGSFTQGQTGATYTIVVTNSGAGPTTAAVSVADSLPSGLTATAIAGTGWTCSLSPLGCSRSDVLAAGASYPAISLTVAVTMAAPASLTNTASVSGGGETNTGNNTVDDVTAIAQLPDLTIAKTHSGSFTQGQTGATYTIVVTNSGAGPTAGGVIVNDGMPAGLIATGMSGAGWTCSVSSLSCSCSRSDVLVAGASYPPITLTVNVSSAAPATTTNRATVAGGGETNTANNTVSDVTSISPATQGDWAITKTATGNFVRGQVGPGYFTIVVSNAGAGTASGVVTVSDALPAGLTVYTMSGTGWSCGGTTTLTCSRSGSLAPGASFPGVFVMVAVASDAPTNLTNTASVSGPGDANPSNNTAAATVTLVSADFTVAKTHSGDFVRGLTGRYVITVTNVGPVSSRVGGLVTVSDALPAGLVATSISGLGWGCTISPLSCSRSLGFLPAGSSYPPINLNVSILGTATATVTNTATVSAAVGEINTGNNTVADVTAIVSPDLAVAKKHVGNFGRGQANASYTIDIRNVGTSSALYGAIVTDTLPVGLAPAGVVGSGWGCTLSTAGGQSRYTCRRSDVLAAGASYPQIAITVNVAANAPASVVNTATVSAPGDFNSANNQSSDVTIIEPADLTITKTHVGNFTRGQPVATYTIQVANIGAGVTNGPIRVTDAVPVGLDLPGAWGSGWACRTVSAGSIECTRSSALAGRTNAPPITLAVSVRNDAANSVINTARVDGGGEVNRSNNEAADPTTIESNVAPTIGSVTPSSLISAAGVPQTFTAVYSDANGYGNLVGVGFLVNAGPFASGGIYVFYNPTLNLLGLGTDSGSGTAGSCTPGSRTTLRNSQGSVDCASARVTGAGSSLTLRVTIVPAAAFASAVAKNLYMEAMDWNYPRTGLIQVGTWTITR